VIKATSEGTNRHCVQGYLGDTAEWEETFAGVGTPTPIPADFHSCEIAEFESFSLHKKKLLLNGYVGTKYRGADKSLARPGRKQFTAIKDFDFHVS